MPMVFATPDDHSAHGTRLPAAPGTPRDESGSLVINAPTVPPSTGARIARVLLIAIVAIAGLSWLLLALIDWRR